MRSYQAARGYFDFLSYVSWGAIGLGGFVAIAAISALTASNSNTVPAALFLASVPGLTLSAVGFFGLVFVQTSRAAVDSAEYGQQALQVSRSQLEVSKQLLKLVEQREPTTGYATTTKETDLKPVSYDTDAATQDDAVLLSTTADAPNPSVAAEPEHLALPDFSKHIAFDSGRYVVNDKRFWSRAEAEDYVKSEVLNPQT